ncbi:hypothetical protein L208DRAFT_1379707 [Tricholoma matsutake]|nr:hypothetical protein L208DRAFT_1379707 [Tricholoma matsutake 945]
MIKFYDINCVIHSIDISDSPNPNLVAEDGSADDDNDDTDDWLLPNPNKSKAMPSETLDVDSHTEFDLESRMVQMVLADQPLPEEVSTVAGDVEMFNAEEGGTYDLAAWI